MSFSGRFRSLIRHHLYCSNCQTIKYWVANLSCAEDIDHILQFPIEKLQFIGRSFMFFQRNILKN